MGQGCVGLRTHICCAHGLLPFTFFKWLATPNVLLQHSQSLQGISGHAQRGSQISKPKSLVPFDSMRKGPYLWKESPVPTHYRPKASSEPLSMPGVQHPGNPGVWATAGTWDPSVQRRGSGAAWLAPNFLQICQVLAGSRHYDACGPGGDPEPGSREQSARARVDHCILSHSRCRATCRTLACSHRVSSWEIHRG